MTRLISLAHLTAVDLPPPRLIEAAANAGFDAVGLRLIRVTDTSPGYPLMHDKGMMDETKAALRDTGLVVNDIEFVKIEPETDTSSLKPFLEAGAELGASEVITAPYDPDIMRLADNLGALAELAADFSLKVSIEFFPWTVVPDLDAALEVARQAGESVGILVDALHFDRSSSTLGQLRNIPSNRLRIAHLCDALVQTSYSTEELLHTARAERLPPGEGQIDLAGFLAALPGDIALGMEVPMTKLATDKGTEEVLHRIMHATRTLLGSTLPHADTKR